MKSDTDGDDNENLSELIMDEIISMSAADRRQCVDVCACTVCTVHLSTGVQVKLIESVRYEPPPVLEGIVPVFLILLKENTCQKRLL